MGMPEKWTGRLVGRMHNEKISYKELASELGLTRAYVSMILNGTRKPPHIRERMESAVSSILERRRAGEQESEG